MKDSRVTVRFSAELRARLKNAAHANGVRESEVIRKAVERQFALDDDATTAYERAKKEGLIGAVKDASPDLGTNIRHMDGFGRS